MRGGVTLLAYSQKVDRITVQSGYQKKRNHRVLFRREVDTGELANF